MEFMGRLKSFLPTVFASETVTEVQKENGAQSMSEGEATEVKSGSNHTEPPKKKEVNLREKPEFYSDILSEGEPNYDYFPERKERYKPAVWKILSMMEGREESHRMRCENNIYNILKEEPLIQLLVGALKSSGCDVDMRRSFSCEVCYSGVCGGYDTKTNQVVMCMNNVSSKQIMTTVMAHELIHMFDHCVNETDFKSPEHLACTEIRAINLTSCSLIDSFFSGYIGIMDIVGKTYHKKHALCVKDRALNSVMAASANLSREEAVEIIEKVFPYCYNDLEPIGRRLRHKTTDGDRAYYDGKHYGYV